MKAYAGCLAGMLALGACTPRSAELRIVESAAAAMGGLDQVRSVRRFTVEGSGDVFALGQNPTLESPLLNWEVQSYRRTTDLVNHRWQEESKRKPTFVTGWPEAFSLIEGYDAGLAFDIEEGVPSRRDGLVATRREAELFHHPLGFLRAASQPAARLERARDEGDAQAVDLVASEGHRFTLLIDKTRKLPRRIVSTSHEPGLGDVTLVTEFSEYRTFDHVAFPTQMTWRIDTTIVAYLRVTRAATDRDTTKPAAPAAVRNAPDPAAGDARVTVEQAAPGVWYLAGESHHSVVVEFADHLTLIEAPVDDRRTLAVIARARTLRPTKPLTEVINTHHHLDHAGGIRAAVSEGLKVITHESNRAFVEVLVSRPSTVFPDALARRPRPLVIETVAEKKVITDGQRSIELYPITGNGHCATMLMVYLPRERLLVEADAYQPPPLQGTPPVMHPWAPNLLENIRRRGLRVSRILPVHGRIVPFAELVAAAK